MTTLLLVLFCASFSHQCLEEKIQIIFYWSLSDSKSHQISRTLQSILANFNSAVVGKS